MKKRLFIELPLVWLMMLMLMFIPQLETTPTVPARDMFASVATKPYDDPEGFLRRTLFVRYDKDYSGKPIICFDAAEDGRTALGFNTGDGLRYAAVLDANGTFQYGFSFRCTGDFQLDWTDEGLGVYWVRSDVFAVFDANGTCLSMHEVDPNSASSRYLNLLESPVRTLPEGGQLCLRNPFSGPASTYAQLVRIAPDGTETVLYDAPGSTAGGQFIWPCILILVGCLMTWLLVRRASDPKNRRTLA